MKRLNWLILLLTLVFPGWAAAAMGDYCSAPPYVTRTIAPNITVVMDNSQNMQGAAYTGSYDPASTYLGYFVPTSCYSHSGGVFREDLENAAACTAAAPFRGNVMNWATMSKYDVLQKVLIGGNSTSKQGNANTLVSVGGTFADKTYNDCIFRVDNANLVLTESEPGACGLLDNPAAPMAKLDPIRSFRRAFGKGLELLFEAVTGGVAQVGTALAAVWEDIHLVNRAWAAALTLNVASGSLNINQNQAYSITLEAGGDNNTIYYWATNPSPPAAWLSGPTYATSGNKQNYRAIWSGTPTVAGTYSFTVTVTDRDSNTPVTRTIAIVVAPETLKMNTVALPAGQRGAAYSFTPSAQGGVKPYTWSATGLPAWASINSATGEITGTPNVVATSTVRLTVADTSGQSVYKDLALVVNAPALNILTDSLAIGTQNVNLLSWIEAGGGVTPYTWTVKGVGPSTTLPGIPNVLFYDFSSTQIYLWGTPTVSGSFPITVTVRDAAGTTTSKDFTLTIAPAAGAALAILENNPLPEATKGLPYYMDFHGAGGGGVATYVWSSSGLPAGASVQTPLIASNYFRLYWVPAANQIGNHNFSITLTSGAETVTKNFTITVNKGATPRTASMSVKVDIDEDPLIDLNGNDIWDLGESYTDADANGQWDGKQGVFQKFWDSNVPKARWGMAKFGAANPVMATCLPASPVAAWYTGIQNATPTTTSPLASGLYAAINYYGFNSPYGLGYTGCANSDPIDNIPCRKNFVLVISSGADVSGAALDSGLTGCTQTDPLVKNACVGFKTDLRSDKAGIQNTFTYVVNTMGASNNDVLEAAALAGGGKYYEASNAEELEDQLVAALQDIVAQAASGTAVSVLTTSSRGIGSMVQAYFLPTRSDGTRDVRWTGYTQDLWIDPQDNLREDTNHNLNLTLDEDKVIKLFFDVAANETRVARFSTDDAGLNGTLTACTVTEADIKPFAETNYLWEAGKKLALRAPGDRDLFTARKVIHGGSVTHTFDSTATSHVFNTLNVTGNATLNNALDEDATYTATNIVRYVRGEDLESTNANFRDRRLTVDGGLHVWKLGDIISSTPKVFAGTPANSYHFDYGDDSYMEFITDPDYKDRSAISFVGANDGVMHAFRVGYLRESGLASGIQGLFQNFVGDTQNGRIGEEIWGYIPFNAFPYLKYLANPGYCHIYFNDLSVRVIDASIGHPDVATDVTAAKTVDSWRTILIGGMRFGGACDASIGGLPTPPLANVGYSAYYAIDITNPEEPRPLWEFSDPGMGYATTYPSIVRTGASKNQNGNWYVAIGSGSSRMPKSSPSADMARTTTGYVYLLDLKTGALVKKVGLGHNAILTDIIAIDDGLDAHVDSLYFGTSYPDPGDNTQWRGKLMSLDLPIASVATTMLCGSTAVERSAADCGGALRTLFDGPYPFTAPPDVTLDHTGMDWVYIGAGKYLSDVDEEDVLPKVFIAVKDDHRTAHPTFTYPVTLADLTDRTNVQTTGTVTSTIQECLYSPAGPVANHGFDNQTLVTAVHQVSPYVGPPARGWYLTLSEGERVISRPMAVGGLVDFLTYKPDSDLCMYGGSSYIYAVDYTTGMAPPIIALRSMDIAVDPVDGTRKTSGEVLVKKGVPLAPGAPPGAGGGDAITITPRKEGQEQLKKKIQVATGVIVEVENTPIISTISKVVHWLKK